MPLKYNNTFASNTLPTNTTPIKVHYAKDNQRPRPSKTHSLAELEEIRQALGNNSNSQIDTYTLYEKCTEFEDIRVLPKGKQPLQGPPKGKCTKAKENATQANTPSPSNQPHPIDQHNNNNKRKIDNPNQNKKSKIARTKEQNSNTTLTNKTPPVCTKVVNEPNTNTKPNINDAHPGYLTLFIYYPTNPTKQPTDSTIIQELQKHKNDKFKSNT
ncbi:hypothetical protein CHS0354_015639 [Potamilus streckersoni]|uniref:Uncharacterized protein n=1 Tax=Potamilus streckersoni TaxID=2493646 RepID=A0AAE0SEN7_9BIVA|nr:hypothetical protein CHS0354_015639 [Potamilus streckersoni]